MYKILFFSIWFLFHPVHVTMTSIDYAPEMKSYRVFIRMYFDDFLRDCHLEAGEIQNKQFAENNSSSRNVMEKYLKEKIMITVNDEHLSGRLKEMNLVDNEISLNLEYGAQKKPKTITVKNLIMTGLYSDMSNMLIVRVNKFEEGMKLTSDLTEQTFNIK